MRPEFNTEYPPIDEAYIERCRRMTPYEKLLEVCRLTEEENQRHRDRILAQYGPMPARELELRVASIRNGRELMVKAFGWDPEVMGW